MIKNKLDNFTLLVFLQQFRILLAGGHSAAQSLKMLAETSGLLRLRTYLHAVNKLLESGGSLNESLFMKGHPFPAGMEHCFHNMPDKNFSLEKLIYSLEENYKLQSGSDGQRIGLITWFFGLFLFTLIMVLITPIFQNMYQGFGSNLPIPTVIVIGFSIFLKKYWIVIPFLLILFFILTIFLKNKFKIPDSRLHYIFSLLSNQIENGADIKQALSWAASSLDKQRYQERIHLILNLISNGSSISEAFRQARIFPEFVVHVIGFGEKGKDLSAAFKNVAGYYRRQQKLDFIWFSFIFFILLIALFGFIIIALYLPLFHMAGTIG